MALAVLSRFIVLFCLFEAGVAAHGIAGPDNPFARVPPGPGAWMVIAGGYMIMSSCREAARGMGMGPLQILVHVELPLALKVIVSGVRVSMVIGVGTAAIGAATGAGGLGAPIISGLISDNPALVMEGAVAGDSGRQSAGRFRAKPIGAVGQKAAYNRKTRNNRVSL
ncbi:MAG: ABC transporter permease subunit [Synergistota bacterium]|nr:ABC transporter permease subunit [Synergistota bacterium]